MPPACISGAGIADPIKLHRLSSHVNEPMLRIIEAVASGLIFLRLRFRCMLLSQFRDEQSCGNTVSCLKKRRAGGVKVSRSSKTPARQVGP
ncbi:hypothetical protein B5K05_23340 [Rhizobium phaseoli]|uniref:Uncharacterized protein n=1 Tax=Rhizobium etli (strain CIAT 652) TaxID=491916 RepID=B3Q409_RHIE6|nr:hypothetical protein RHECIAT_PC0000736 [Rhizobium etli CIAT 652]ANL50888.1 hypothetical protein AMC87_PD00765 [Rhizobium phaseoli]EGE61293.1 hypothetical protein RHECNPAF_122100115 [Rhizobium etli CNPAF512]KKZ84058.1 hypothetical protein RPHASCH2410_PD03920 [Rhizobium phaseoli Ch24-10]PCD68931.1 hypothetical protein CO648_08170 [Rhizobium phaseoli]